MHLHTLSIPVSTSTLFMTLFQLVSGGPQYLVEYVVVEANCTNDACMPLNDPMAVSMHSISLVFQKNNHF